MAKPCKWCGADWHASTFCRLAPKQPIKVRKPLKPVGKVGMKWQKFRNQWHKDHPGPHLCGVCGLLIKPEELTLDHILPRSARPDLRTDPANIQPAHWLCNMEKGSTHG